MEARFSFVLVNYAAVLWILPVFWTSLPASSQKGFLPDECAVLFFL